MVRILSRPLALVFAVALVGGAGWALSRPYYRSIFGSWGGREFNCICITTNIDETAGWPRLDAGAFWVRAPRETTLRQDTNLNGAFLDRRFTLKYVLSDPADVGAFTPSGQTFREEAVTVGGRDGVFRSAEFPGREEPLFLSLIVPRAMKDKRGRWYALEIQGWFLSWERRNLAEKMLRTVDFTPAFDQIVTPRRPHIDPPTIEIIYPSAKETP